MSGQKKDQRRQAENIVAKMPAELAQQMHAALRLGLQLDSLAIECIDIYRELTEAISAARPGKVSRDDVLHNEVMDLDGTGVLFDLLVVAQLRLSKATGVVSGETVSHRYLNELVDQVRGGDTPLARAAQGSDLSIEQRLERAEQQLQDQREIVAMAAAVLGSSAR